MRDLRAGGDGTGNTDEPRGKGLTGDRAGVYAAIVMKTTMCDTPVQDASKHAVEASSLSCSTAFYFWYFTTPPAALAGRFRVMST
jgi:hypothetical protein